jgi:hypothetical protein
VAAPSPVGARNWHGDKCLVLFGSHVRDSVDC